MPIIDAGRTPVIFPAQEVEDIGRGRAKARELFAAGEHNAAFDLYAALAKRHPGDATPVLADAYDQFRALPTRDRYTLYQSRFFTLPVAPGMRVLDVGSGHLPFPLATHLSDITLTDDAKGRAGHPVRHLDGKAVFEFPVESIPFETGFFDFVYCSHVLEHAQDPARACRELMRVGRAGYIETPTHGKDVFLDSAVISNHRYTVEVVDGVLVFVPYDGKRPQGLGADILMSMHVAPQTEREKAFSALIYLHADQVNTMFVWEKDFPFEVFRPGARFFSPPAAARHDAQPQPEPSAAPQQGPCGRALRLLQVHTFYEEYLRQFFRQRPGLNRQSHATQVAALLDHGFSTIHLLSRHMPPFGYETGFHVANCESAQHAWAEERGIAYREGWDGLMDILARQVDDFAPDVLYLTDPLNLHHALLPRLARRPPLVLGWRAANVPADTDWSAFDVLLSNLPAMREAALRLGAASAEAFYPGFPVEYFARTGHIGQDADVVFAGSVNIRQYPRRIPYLEHLGTSAREGAFGLRLHLNGDLNAVSGELAAMSLPPVFGLDMYASLRRGRIAFDARGRIALTDKDQNPVEDLAGRNTSNMRIFEATGLGRFLLTEYHDNLPDLFDIGREIEVYHDEVELLDKIRHYLKHTDEREAIAERGRLRCHRDHDIRSRCRDFDRIVRRGLGRRGGV
jgi:hypothetical protein